MIEPIFTSIDITNLPAEIFAANRGLTNAIPNDGLSDQSSIQAAIDWVAAQQTAGFVGKTTIYIPEGVFDLARTLKVDASDITFEGTGTGLTILQNSDTFNVGTEGLPDGDVVIGDINRDAYLFALDEDTDSVAFTNMTLTGPEVHGAVFAVLADNLEISEVQFKNFGWSAVRLFAVSNAKIHDNVFIDAGGQAQGTEGTTGGSVFASYLSNSEIYNNDISRSGKREGNVYGIKGREFRDTRIYNNTIDTNFAIELPFESDRLVEIDHNFLNGVVSIPKFAGGSVPENGYTFYIHHNYFTSSYSLEWPRNGAEIDHNVFVFDSKLDDGNLISGFASEPAEGPTKFHNNLILNPGRGIFWSEGVYNNFSFYNNEVIANETITPRVEGLFGFNGNTDFSTIAIKDNIIKVNGLSRPLLRNEESYGATIENNILTNVSDLNKLSNLDTGAPRGLLEPLLFTVGVDNKWMVDGFDLSPVNTASTQYELC
jgi:nitrous oxidase accessory protein